MKMIKVQLALTVVFAIFSALTINAEKAQAVTVSPVRIELAVDPGQSIDSSIKIYNNERGVKTYYLFAAKFDSQDETGQPHFIPNDKTGIVSWTNLPTSIDVGPQQSQNVNFSISVPAGTDPGGYFGAVLISQIPPSPSGFDISLQSEVGTLLFLKVNGNFKQGETILEFETKDKNHTFNHLPIEFFFRFQNSGADRAQPIGDITLKNMFGGTAKIISANPSAGNVLPESVRKFEMAWVTAGGDIVERFNDKIEYPEFLSFTDAVKYQWKHFAVGKYTANLQLVVNNDSSRHYAGTLSFWVFPWQLLLVIAVATIVFMGPLLLLVIVIIWLIRRNRRSRS